MGEIIVFCLIFFVSFPALMIWAGNKDKERQEAKNVFMVECLKKDRVEQCEAIWVYSEKEGRK